MPSGYYQLGGFQSPIKWYQFDDKTLSQVIAGDASPLRPRNEDSKSPVELILGIKRTGSSHLLLTESQTSQIARAMDLGHPRDYPVPATDFQSLSPIYFHDAHELEKKLGTLKVKAVKGAKERKDHSQANKQFLSGEDGVQRGEFELGRLLCRILQRDVDPRKYGLDDPPLPHSIRICSFVFNTRPNDVRPRADRLEIPILLDCGLSEVTVPDLKQRSGATLHFSFSNQAFLNKGSRKLSFDHGITEALDSSLISVRLQDFFKDHSDPTANPMILLVHGEEETRNALKNSGVDTSKWKSGIRELFFETVKVKHEPGLSRLGDPRVHQSNNRRRNNAEASRNNKEYRNNRLRSRSRSPRRSYGQNAWASSSSYQDTSRRSPAPRYPASQDSQVQHRGAYAPVYLVDIQEQYKKLMQTALGSETVNQISEYLGISKDVGWCAGNEAMLILDVWRSMISGPAIDEQRALRMATQVLSRTAVTAIDRPGDPEDADNESDMDPNDIIQMDVPQAIGDPDSDSDYGESDSD